MEVRNWRQKQEHGKMGRKTKRRRRRRRRSMGKSQRKCGVTVERERKEGQGRRRKTRRGRWVIMNGAKPAMSTILSLGMSSVTTETWKDGWQESDAVGGGRGAVEMKRINGKAEYTKRSCRGTRMRSNK